MTTPTDPRADAMTNEDLDALVRGARRLLKYPDPTSDYYQCLFDLLAVVEALRVERDEAQKEAAEMRKRAAKAELRTLALYTPLWEHGYNCPDFEAQAIVGEALADRTAQAARIRELEQQLAEAREDVDLRRLVAKATEAEMALQEGVTFAPPTHCQWYGELAATLRAVLYDFHNQRAARTASEKEERE